MRLPVRCPAARRALAGLLATTLGATLPLAGAPAHAADTAPGTTPDGAVQPPAHPATTASSASSGDAAAAPGCANPLLRAPMRADRALTTLGARAAARAANTNHTSLKDLQRTARDHSAWLDRCGRSFYIDAAPTTNVISAAAAQQPAATTTTPLSQTFTLASRPQSTKTIYLDFTGHTFAGTAWNDSYTAGAPFTSPAYSITDPADTNFTDDELTQIQIAWASVAEDYAPFDVNVTTAEPSTSDLVRSDPTDTRFGERVVVSAGGPVYGACGCGGIAYLSTFGESVSWAAKYHPALVFTDGTTTDGSFLAQAASHELGHNFGLHHDGDANGEYAGGYFPWSPIMGSSYSLPLSQWSSGEYQGATNHEDDTATIAAAIGYGPDDVSDDPVNAPLLQPGTPFNALIGTRDDADTFRFDAYGITHLDVTPTSAAGTNLDVTVTIRDADGNVVAHLDPNPPYPYSDVWSREKNLAVSWTKTLDDPRGTYTATVDGVGNGDPLLRGQYSDYGSLGAYRITVTADGVIAPLTVTGTDPDPQQVQQPLSITPFTVTGGVEPYTWAASGLPPGLTMDPATAAISGTPTTPGTYPVTATATDSRGATSQHQTTLWIQHPPVTTAHYIELSATAGTDMTRQLHADNGDGTYTWASTAGPAWLRLDPDGTLHGVPPTSGLWDLNATVTSEGHSATTQVRISATWPAFLPRPLTRTASVGDDLTIDLHDAVTGGTGDYSFRISGWAPVGVQADLSADGQLKVHATQAGTRDIDVIISRGWDQVRSVVTIDARPTRLVAPSEPTLESRMATWTRVDLVASGGDGDGTYLWSGTNLPPGLTLGERGTLFGVATTPGVWSSTLTVTSGDQSITRPVQVTVHHPPVSLEQQSAVGTKGQPLTAQFSVYGGDGTNTWRALDPLPAGLTLSPAGRLTGTPTVYGDFTVHVSVASDGTDATGLATITIARPIFTELTTTLPTARLGRAYRAQVKVAGNENHVTWTTRRLPTWVTVRPNSTGTVLTLTGTAKRLVQTYVTFTAQDGASGPSRTWSVLLVVKR